MVVKMNEQILSNDPDEDIAPVSPFGAIDYGVTADELAALASSFKDITSIESRKDYDAAQAAVTRLTRARTSVESRRKELKKESLEFGRLVDSTGKELMAVVEPEEQRLKALVDEVKAKKAAEKAERERIEKERVDAILNAIADIEKVPATLQRASSSEVLTARDALEARELTEDEFAEFTERAFDTKHQVLQELNELYAGALHDEKIAEKEKAEREAQEAAQKAESERLAKERAELEAKQKEIDAENQRKADELAKQQAEIQAERDRIEAEKRAEVERVEKERIAKERAEAQAKAEKEAKKREAALKPDREKLALFVDQYEEPVLPGMSTAEGRQARTDIQRILANALGDMRRVVDCLGEA
jgi:septal ring factor EnvC (AmiA/AmiB activator)